MSFREILKYIIDLAPKVLSGLVIVIYLYSVLVMPDLLFAKSTLGKILLITIVCSLLTFILYSKHELSNNKMRTRFILHGISLAAVAPGLFLYWNWIPRTLLYGILAVAITLALYALIMWHMYLRHKNLTEQLNAIIQRKKE